MTAPELAPTMTTDEIRQRPTLTVEQAGRVLGLGRGGAYAAARAGTIPTIRVGRRLLVPSARLLKLLEGDVTG